MIKDSTKRQIKPAEFHRLLEDLFKIENSASSFGSMPLRLAMRRILRPQIGFQTQFAKGYVREAMLIDETASPMLRNLFKQETGCSVTTFLDVAYLCVILTQGSKSPQFMTEEIYKLDGAYSRAELKGFIKSISKSPKELGAFMQSLPDAASKKPSECFEFPVLVNSPIIREGARLVVWHPQLLDRGLEHFVHNTLAKSGHIYAQAFGPIFEDHVNSELLTLSMSTYDEATLKSWRSNDDQKHPDGLIDHPKCNVFIEAKSGLYKEPVMTVGSGEIFRTKTKEIAKGVEQAWEASCFVRQSGLAPVPIQQKDQDFLIIVTNIQLWIGNGLRLNEMYDQRDLRSPDPQGEVQLPLQNVFILDIDEFEWLMSGIRKEEIDLFDLLSDCATKEMTPKTSVVTFSQRLSSSNAKYDCSAGVSRVFSESTNRIHSAVLT